MSLEKISKYLSKASEELKLVGWHGCKALQEPACELANKLHDQHWLVSVEVLGSRNVLSKHIEGIARQIDASGKRIVQDAPSVNTAFGEGPEFGRRTGKPTKTAALFSAAECAKAYHALSDAKPTVRTKDGTAYGPFLEFVTDIFLALDIEASPETWARIAAKENSSEK